MTIDRLNPLDPIQPHKNSTPKRIVKNTGKDTVSLSQEALAKAELFNVIEQAKAAPDVRMDRIEEVKAKLANPNYINDAILSLTADRILDQLI